MIAVGGFYDGKIVMYEAHFYATSGEDHWYVCYSTYAKSESASAVPLPEAPSIGLDWEAWSGISTNGDETYDLKGSAFAIQEQIGPFFRAEMEQEAGDKTVTKLLNGLFVDSYTVDGKPIVMGYIIDESRMVWNITISPTTLILRTNTDSELSEMLGDAVTVERIYRYKNILGPPTIIPIDSTLMGTWVMTSGYSVYGNGDTITLTDSFSVTYDEKTNALFTGTGTDGSFEDSTRLAYAVTNPNYLGGYLYHTSAEYYGDSMKTSGYAWISEDGNTMYLYSFWVDDQNGITCYILERA